VIIKKLCESIGDSLISEISTLMQMKAHPNILPIYGICAPPNDAIVVQFQPGSLDKTLKDTSKSIPFERKLQWIKGIASAMNHLHAANIISGDLAARRILLRDDNTAVVTAFGFSRRLYKKNAIAVREPHSGFMPVKWMAPEVIKTGQFSKAGDVWSFGILLFEILTRTEPLFDVDDPTEATRLIENGFIPILPDDSPSKELYELCCQTSTWLRPNFDLICEYLEQSDKQT